LPWSYAHLKDIHENGNKPLLRSLHVKRPYGYRTAGFVKLTPTETKHIIRIPLATRQCTPYGAKIKKAFTQLITYHWCQINRKFAQIEYSKILHKNPQDFKTSSVLAILYSYSFSFGTRTSVFTRKNV